jgi:hypothetical protein
VNLHRQTGPAEARRITNLSSRALACSNVATATEDEVGGRPETPVNGKAIVFREGPRRAGAGLVTPESSYALPGRGAGIRCAGRHRLDTEEASEVSGKLKSNQNNVSDKKAVLFLQDTLPHLLFLKQGVAGEKD